MSETKKEIKVNFVDGVGIGKLTNTNLQNEFLATAENPTYELRFRKDRNKTITELWNETENKPLAVMKTDPEKITDKLIGKGRKEIMFEKIIQIFGGDPETGFDSLPDAGTQLKKILEGYGLEVYQYFKPQTESGMWAKSRNSGFEGCGRGIDNKLFLAVEPEYKEQAEELLKDPNLLERIDKIIEIDIKGREKERVAVFIYEIQAYTPYFIFLINKGDSSVGKSWIVSKTLLLLPPESYEIIGRMSKRALERINANSMLKIIFVQEARGAEQASDAVRLSSSSDGGMVAWVVDVNSGELVKYKVDPRMFISTSTNVSFYIEDSTRTLFCYLDYDPDQGVKVRNKQANDAEYPDSLKETLQMVDPNRYKIIQNAIRMLDPEIEVIIPYMKQVSENIDTTDPRIQRDHLAFIGHIYAVAWLHQKQREIITVGDKKYILATPQDLETVIKYCLKNLNETYYGISPDTEILLDSLDILIEQNKKDHPDWTKNKGSYPSGVHTQTFYDYIFKEYGHGREWVDKRRDALLEKGLISRVYEQARENVRAGYYYDIVSKLDYNLLRKIPDNETLLKATEKYKKELQEKINNTIPLPQPAKRTFTVNDPQSDSGMRHSEAIMENE